MTSINTKTQLDKAIREARAQGKKSLSVDKGLRLKLKPEANIWEFRSQRAGANDLRTWIGNYPEMSLAQARAKAVELYERTRSGENVRRKAEKEKDRQRNLSETTVAELWPSWWSFMCETKHPYKNAKDYEKNESRWRDHVMPEIGRKRPADVKPQNIANIYNRTSAGKSGATTKKLKALLNHFFGWCAASGVIPENARLPNDPMRLRPLLSTKNAQTEEKHKPMCPVPEVPRFIASLVNHPRFREPTSGSAMGLLFAILTASRTGNIGQAAGVARSRTTCALWRDLSPDWSLLTIPADRMKASRNGNHVIPLSEPCIRILRRLDRLGMRGNADDPIFSGENGQPVASGTFLQFAQKLHDEDIANGSKGFKDPETGRKATPHGIARASFRSWAQEQELNWETVKMCMHQRPEDVLGRAYARGTAIEARRRILEQWADYCMSQCPDDWDAVPDDWQK